MSVRPSNRAAAPGSTVLRQLVRQFRPGYYLACGTGGHHPLYGPDGQPVRWPTGQPVLLPSSPHQQRERRLAAQLRKLGVIA